MLLSRRADEATLARFLDQASTEPLSYPEVGATFGTTPAGYRHDDDLLVFGRGLSDYERAIEGLRDWQAHRAAGVRVRSSTDPMGIGTTVALALPLAGFYVLAACRIVAVVDEPNRFGFAYGTLQSHPERGEEAFIVGFEQETVTFRISAFSRPADVLARLGAPITRHLQRRVTLAYLDGLARYVSNKR